MNLLSYQSISSVMKNSTVPQIFDSVTYDQYESSNPFRLEFFENDKIKNKPLRQTINTMQNVGAEVYSIYANPFYLSHKALYIPQNIAELYNKYSSKS